MLLALKKVNMKNRNLLYVFLIVFILAGAACKKRTAAVPPVSPAQPSTPPPAVPIISLSADRPEIEEGDRLTLAWKTENAASVSITGLGEVETNGSVQVAPRSSITHTATARGPGGSATDTVRITVTSRPSEEAPPAPAPAKPVITLVEDFLNNSEDIHFEYDRAAIQASEIPKLERFVRWLREHPEARIVIEGHCDDRGSEDYNIALGDSRASSVRTYLTDAGISRDRLEIVSYGEERPVCREESESCWSRNRRAHFVLTTP